MKQYHDILQQIMDFGEDKGNRTGTGTRSIFGTCSRYDLREGFPLVTTKYVNWKHVIGEILWFLKGDTNVNTLNSKIWDNWTDDSGDIGPMYGEQLRSFPTLCPSKPFPGQYSIKTIDQVQDVIDNINQNPNSRRHIMTTLNLGFVADESVDPKTNVEEGRMALWPCHGLIIQFYTHLDGGLSMSVYVRSNDFPLGAPYNIAGYAFLLKLIAQQTNRFAKDLVYMTGDTHIYKNQFEGIKEQLTREIRPLPKLVFKKFKKFDEYTIDDFDLLDYNPHEKIKMKVSI